MPNNWKVINHIKAANSLETIKEEVFKRRFLNGFASLYVEMYDFMEAVQTNTLTDKNYSDVDSISNLCVKLLEAKLVRDECLT